MFIINMFKKLINLSFDIIKSIAGSFKVKDNDSDASARKISAFYFFCLAGYINIKHSNDSNSTEMLVIDILAGLFLLGLVTFDQLLRFKNNTETKNQEDGKPE